MSDHGRQLFVRRPLGINLKMLYLMRAGNVLPQTVMRVRQLFNNKVLAYKTSQFCKCLEKPSLPPAKEDPMAFAKIPSTNAAF